MLTRICIQKPDCAAVYKYWTNTRFVCTHLNVFVMLKPNMAEEIEIEIF